MLRKQKAIYMFSWVKSRERKGKKPKCAQICNCFSQYSPKPSLHLRAITVSRILYWIFTEVPLEGVGFVSENRLSCAENTQTCFICVTEQGQQPLLFAPNWIPFLQWNEQLVTTMILCKHLLSIFSKNDSVQAVLFGISFLHTTILCKHFLCLFSPCNNAVQAPSVWDLFFPHNNSMQEVLFGIPFLHTIILCKHLLFGISFPKTMICALLFGISFFPHNNSVQALLFGVSLLISSWQPLMAPTRRKAGRSSEQVRKGQVSSTSSHPNHSMLVWEVLEHLLSSLAAICLHLTQIYSPYELLSGMQLVY